MIALPWQNVGGFEHVAIFCLFQVSRSRFHPKILQIVEEQKSHFLLDLDRILEGSPALRWAKKTFLHNFPPTRSLGMEKLRPRRCNTSIPGSNSAQPSPPDVHMEIPSSWSSELDRVTVRLDADEPKSGRVRSGMP